MALFTIANDELLYTTFAVTDRALLPFILSTINVKVSLVLFISITSIADPTTSWVLNVVPEPSNILLPGTEFIVKLPYFAICSVERSSIVFTKKLVTVPLPCWKTPGCGIDIIMGILIFCIVNDKSGAGIDNVDTVETGSTTFKTLGASIITLVSTLTLSIVIDNS